MPCNLVNTHQCIGRTCCLNLQGVKWRQRGVTDITSNLTKHTDFTDRKIMCQIPCNNCAHLQIFMHKITTCPHGSMHSVSTETVSLAKGYSRFKAGSDCVRIYMFWSTSKCKNPVDFPRNSCTPRPFTDLQFRVFYLLRQPYTFCSFIYVNSD